MIQMSSSLEYPLDLVYSSVVILVVILHLTAMKTQLMNTFTINSLCFVCWVKNSADDILNYFSYFSQKREFDISGKLSP